MDILKGLAFAIFIAAFGIWVFGDRWLSKEIEQNDSHEPPSDQQIRWHLRHIRQDLHALVLISYVIAVALVATLLLKS